MDVAVDAFGARLRRWRRHRGLSQMALALDAGVSARHLSWLENAKSSPSRAMVLRLAERLDLPLRERDAWLRAAGFAPMFGARSLQDPALQGALQAVRRLLAAHEPWPALAVDRHWNVVAANRVVHALLASVDLPAFDATHGAPLNVLRLSLHPQGLAPMIEGLPAWRAHVLARLERALAAGGDEVLAALLQELRAYPVPVDGTGDAAHDTDAVVVPLVLNAPTGRLAFLTTVTVFGAPQDVTLSELAIETLLPADEATAGALRALHATLPADEA